MSKRTASAALAIALMLTGCADNKKDSFPTPVFTSKSSSAASARPAVSSATVAGVVHPGTGIYIASSSSESEQKAPEQEFSDDTETSEAPEASETPETPEPSKEPDRTFELPTIIPEKPDYGVGELTYFAPGSLNPASKIINKTGKQPRPAASKEYIIQYMSERTGLTGEELQFEGDWCTMILSDILRYLGYDIYRATNPCDLAITLLNNDYGDFVCFREENLESLMYYGLKDSRTVKMMTREEYIPQRGDLIVFRWEDAEDGINWSHIGIVSEEYDGSMIKSLEGNTSLDELVEDPLMRYIYTRDREYDETVVGFIRLKQ